jgi:hypothetical protein
MNAVQRFLKKVFIQDINYNLDDNNQIPRYFSKTPNGVSHYNHIDILELDAFITNNAKFSGRPKSVEGITVFDQADWEQKIQPPEATTKADDE